ncbi:MAG: peptidylprolyl isomerase [Spirochaetales bacterium]|nr:peptidylprolyl isomerase [Spirochaetales bacterium]MCF7938687.1 peptidylprolyl isomerase [Spirochaetales bacterium]
MEDSSRPVCRISTSMGDIDVELFNDETPVTVSNFIGLAEGIKEYTDPDTGKKETDNYYDGLTFHRVIKNFMIQGGDPLGNGRGGPGYTFGDEINADSLGLDEVPVINSKGATKEWLMVRSQEEFSERIVAPIVADMGIESQEEFDKNVEKIKQRIDELTIKELYQLQGYTYTTENESHWPDRGMLAMANSGPNTNGSQFFITHVQTPWLAGRHTVFGRVLDGMDVVDKIAETEVNEQGQPVEEITIEKIRLIKKADES